MIQTNDRLGKLPPYLFAEIDRKKKQLIEAGHKVLNLGIGDPDLPTPPHIVEALQKAAANPATHHYPLGKGMASFRRTIADYYRKHMDVSLSPDDEICVLIGSKEGIAHFPTAFLNPGDVTLVPEPGYPVYHIGTMLAGGTSHFMPLVEENGFLPDLGAIPENVVRRAGILYLNYPNNPTAAFAPREYLTDAIAFAKKYDIIILYDAAYHEMYFQERPVSFLSLPGAKDVGIELHSLSKTYSMTGWRVGWACGNRDLVAGLAKLKENIDSGTFDAIQIAGIEALGASQQCVEEMRAVYRGRKDILFAGLTRLGWKIREPKGTFYFWAKIPGGGNSIQTVNMLLEKAHIVCTPGIGFGPSGEGYVRFALTAPEAVLKEAIERLETNDVKRKA